MISSRLLLPLLLALSPSLSASAGSTQATKEPVDCGLPADAGYCYMDLPSWYFDAGSGECEEFIYGGCDGNSNRFETKDECESACPKEPVDCGLPADAGYCLAHFPSWYFDAGSGECEEFIYGGCDGNSNRFETKDECESACPKEPVDCGLPADTGYCRKHIPSWYFDAGSGECEDFIYGGCDGNSNRFETKDECESACPGAGRAATSRFLRMLE